MPVRNSRKTYASSTFYHVYARGRSKSIIFRAETDYYKFLSLFRRYLSVQPEQNEYGIYYPHYYKRIELISFCLMPNHIHLMVYQNDDKAMQQFMQSLLSSYTMYINLKYRESGPLFESRYKASLIDNDQYYQHISRYIHCNPKNWMNYKFSSLKFFLGELEAEWLKPHKIRRMFKGANDYFNFLNDYKRSNEQLKIGKYLADF